MPSEYVMYMSILFVGTLAIAGISVTMIGMNNALDDRAIEVNLEQILQKLSETIHNLKEDGEKQLELGAQEVTIEVSLTLPETIQDQEYKIEVLTETADNSYNLKGSLIDKETVQSVVSLYIYTDEITIGGVIDSRDNAPLIVYTSNGITSQITLTTG